MRRHCKIQEAKQQQFVVPTKAVAAVASVDGISNVEDRGSIWRLNSMLASHVMLWETNSVLSATTTRAIRTTFHGLTAAPRLGAEIVRKALVKRHLTSISL